MIPNLNDPVTKDTKLDAIRPVLAEYGFRPDVVDEILSLHGPEVLALAIKDKLDLHGLIGELVDAHINAVEEAIFDDYEEEEP